MSALHDRELADTREADRLKRERAAEINRRFLEQTAADLAAASMKTTARRDAQPGRVDDGDPARALAVEAATRLTGALEAEETPPDTRREQLEGVLRMLHDLGVFHRRAQTGAAA